MGKIKTKSLKTSMAVTFFITICVTALLSSITIFTANQVQHEILKKRYMTINSPDFQMDENTGNYILDIDNNNITWQPLSRWDTVIYYGSYAAMVGLPVFYIAVGIGAAAAVYYRKKLREPITQLQNGVERIQEDNLDFHIEYDGDDELGRLCCSMEKMRGELRQKHKALWESLEQRKLLNASVSHDLRTPITVLKGYLDYLEKNIPQDKLTEDMLLDTVSSMQGAVNRLELYVESVRDIEKIEIIEIEKRSENVKLLLNELRSNVRQLAGNKEIIISNDITVDKIQIDKGVFFRILENLLQNALRYAEKQVSINLSHKKDFLILTVKDDGKGFSAADLEKATTAFYSNDKEKQHFGIGLSVCKILCEKHGGLLYVGNQKEKGACVTAKLKSF
ncbi:HAMP domain-containing sensor histidine kinase [Acutalibacter intestini]|uniref:HAMP domain-containing sensor histidine kinase n=1 Tax=Acutalibacter intestini TaxID=3093659 RepID=UPI002AC8BDE2|nr:HAMP domain-containing sensor histidine kinase [Acutalibacter sp. M00204]